MNGLINLRELIPVKRTKADKKKQCHQCTKKYRYKWIIKDRKGEDNDIRVVKLCVECNESMKEFMRMAIKYSAGSLVHKGE